MSQMHSLFYKSGTLVISLLLTFSIAWVGGYFTSLSVNTWYPTLNKPEWTPSGRTIGLVWTFLYSAMAVAAWLVFLNEASGKRICVMLYGVQLCLNLLWSVLFFGFQNPGAAFLNIVLLEILVIATMLCFWGMSKTAGMLFIPYAVWVGFAGYLNFAIWRLN